MTRLALLLLTGCFVDKSAAPRDCTVNYGYTEPGKLQVDVYGGELGRVTVVVLDRSLKATGVVGLADSYSPSVQLVMAQPPPVEDLTVLVTTDSGAVCR